MEPQPEREAIQGPTLPDMPTEMVHRIGDFLKPFDKRRLGVSIYKHGVGRQYLLGQKKIILDHAASKIQSALKSPYIHYRYPSPKESIATPLRDLKFSRQGNLMPPHAPLREMRRDELERKVKGGRNFRGNTFIANRYGRPL